MRTHGNTGTYRHGCRCSECRKAHTTYSRLYRQKRGSKYIRSLNLKWTHNLTIQDYELLLLKQNGVCACCGQVEKGRNQYGILPLAVDHNHKTGRIRGLLCMKCNRALGLIGDSLLNIKQLLKYKEADV